MWINYEDNGKLPFDLEGKSLTNIALHPPIRLWVKNLLFLALKKILLYYYIIISFKKSIITIIIIIIINIVPFSLVGEIVASYRPVVDCVVYLLSFNHREELLLTSDNSSLLYT